MKMGSENLEKETFRERGCNGVLSRIAPFFVGLVIGGVIAIGIGINYPASVSNLVTETATRRQTVRNDRKDGDQSLPGGKLPQRRLKVGYRTTEEEYEYEYEKHDYPTYYTEPKVSKDDYYYPDDSHDDHHEKYKCYDVKKGKPILIVGSWKDFSEYSEGDVTENGERYIWYGTPESGICTVIAEKNATGFVTQLCRMYYKFTDDVGSFGGSTLAVEGTYVTNLPGGDIGEGHYTITGGTGCFRGVSGVVREVYSPTQKEWIDSIELEDVP